MLDMLKELELKLKELVTEPVDKIRLLVVIKLETLEELHNVEDVNEIVEITELVLEDEAKDELENELDEVEEKP